MLPIDLVERATIDVDEHPARLTKLHLNSGCDTMCHMRAKATVRDLHLKTSEILRRVSDGDTFVIEKHGTPIAEIGPVAQKETARMPDREKLLRSLPRVKIDSGAILEQDRI
jgi:prevent-host-death family protein